MFEPRSSAELKPWHYLRELTEVQVLDMVTHRVCLWSFLPPVFSLQAPIAVRMAKEAMNRGMEVWLLY